MRIVKLSGTWLLALAILCLSFPAPLARAQSYPSRTVHIIVGISPGGGVDTTARVLAQQLSKLWGQPVVVENRLGAAGAVATEFVAKAAPDGYTLLVVSDNITATSALRSDLPYDLLKDLTPVSLLATAPEVVAVRPSLPVQDMKQLIALAKSEPGKLTFGSPGIGSVTHLYTALFASMAHLNIVHVPYKGTSAAMVGAAGGEVDMIFGNMVSAQSLVTAGKLRVLAITSPHHSPLYPSIPTVAESGVPGYSYVAWFAMFAPANLPPNVLAALGAGLAKGAASPEVKAALLKQGLVAQTDMPAQFAKFVRADLKQKVQIVQSIGLKTQ